MNNQLATVDTVKTQIQLALTKQSLSVQGITDKINGITPNEDNLQEMADAIKLLQAMDSAIEAKHKELKAPHLEAGRVVDNARKDMLALTASLRAKIQPKYVAICQSIAARKKQEEEESLRIKTAKDAIDSSILTFSQKIAACTTSDELVSLERFINLDKARKDKYHEFIGEYIDRANNTLLPLLTKQKETVRELEALNRTQVDAEDDEAIIAIAERKEALEAQMSHTQIQVQETAINQSLEAHSHTVNATAILPAVRARRTTWEYEVEDISLLSKKMPQLVKLEPDHDAIKTYLKGKKQDGSIKEETINGLKIFQKVTY